MKQICSRQTTLQSYHTFLGTKWSDLCWCSHLADLVPNKHNINFRAHCFVKKKNFTFSSYKSKSQTEVCYILLNLPPMASEQRSLSGYRKWGIKVWVASKVWTKNPLPCEISSHQCEVFYLSWVTMLGYIRYNLKPVMFPFIITPICMV